MKNIIQIILIFVATILAFFLFVIFYQYGARIIWNSAFPQWFKSEMWKQVQFSSDDISSLQTTRETHDKMVYSLLRQNMLDGRTKEEVEQILGLEENEFSADIWTYTLLPATLDDRSLIVEFKNNLVTTARIIED